MSSHKSEEIKLKGPDVFQAKVAEFLAGLVQNPKPLIGFGVFLLVALLAGYGIRYFIGHKQEVRRVELSKVDQVFEEEGKAYNKAREALEKKRDTLKAAQPKPAAEAKDAKPQEDGPEIKALDAQIKELKPDHAASSEQYKTFYVANPKNAEGWVAGLKYASFAAEQNKLEDAQKILEDLTKNAQGHAILQTQGLLLLISILEDRGEFDKALEQVNVLEKTASADLKPRVLLSKAQIYYFKKDFANTKETASKLLADYDNTPEADRARSLLGLLPE